MSNTEQKKGKGRPSGTKSYAAVKVSELQDLVKGGFVPVSKKWLKDIGVNIADYPDWQSKPINLKKRIEKSVVLDAAKHSEKEVEPEDKIEFRVEV